MADSAYKHGITINETTDGGPALTEVSTSDIGLVVTAPAADVTMFPLDTPILITDLSAAIGKIGATGTGKVALQAIYDIVQTPVILVRVAPGLDQEATDAAVIGDTVNGKKTGLQALLAAQATVRRKPRILGAPGLDTQPVAAALAIVAKKLRGFAYAAAIGEDITEAIAYRSNFGSRELMLLYPDWLATDSTGAPAPSWASARALGLRALIDQTQGWNKTLSNVDVPGVLGLTKDVQFDIQDSTLEAGLLNAAGITACVHTGAGYRFWGDRTTSDDPNFAFESDTRTAQVIADTLGQGLLWAIDQPLRPSLAKDIVERINGLFGAMTRNGEILGARASFDPAKNPSDQLALGKLRLTARYTSTPPLEDLEVDQIKTLDFLATFAAGTVSTTQL